MTLINASQFDYKCLNKIIQTADDSVTISDVLGQRFIAAGLGRKHIQITGIPGNALGAYLNGAQITVYGNTQDAVGDTMNEGKIIIHGNIGDAAGYAMRGGKLFVKGNAGYRAGIHMKEYGLKRPVMVIGGRCGSFLGEYQAGGLIIVLGLHTDGKDIVGNFPCTGMHGGCMYLRSDCRQIHFPHNVIAQPASQKDLAQIDASVSEFCDIFGYDKETIMNSPFTKIVPDSKNPYKQMYVAN